MVIIYFYIIKMLGSYKIVKKLQRGAFGIVYEVMSEKEEKWAIKVIDIQPQNKEQIRQQCRIGISLKHPNLIYTHQFFFIQNEQKLCLVMELCDGSLAQCISTLPNQEMVARGIAEAMSYLHLQNIVHRDLKPQNILLRQGIPKICDFGLSKIGAMSMTSKVGTQYYMAPESRKLKYTQKVDVWAYGLIILQIFFGTRINILVNSEMPFMEEVMPEVSLLEKLSPQIRFIVEGALKKNPQERMNFIQILKIFKGQKISREDKYFNYPTGTMSEVFKKPYLSGNNYTSINKKKTPTLTKQTIKRIAKKNSSCFCSMPQQDEVKSSVKTSTCFCHKKLVMSPEEIQCDICEEQKPTGWLCQKKKCSIKYCSDCIGFKNKLNESMDKKICQCRKELVCKMEEKLCGNCQIMSKISWMCSEKKCKISLCQKCLSKDALKDQTLITDKICLCKNKLKWIAQESRCLKCENKTMGFYGCSKEQKQNCKVHFCYPCVSKKQYGQACPNSHSTQFINKMTKCVRCGNVEKYNYQCNVCEYSCCIKCTNAKFQDLITLDINSFKCPNNDLAKWVKEQNTCSICQKKMEYGLQCGKCKIFICSLCSKLKYGKDKCPSGHVMCWTANNASSRCVDCRRLVKCGWVCCDFFYCIQCSKTKVTDIVSDKESPVEKITMSGGEQYNCTFCKRLCQNTKYRIHLWNFCQYCSQEYIKGSKSARRY